MNHETRLLLAGVWAIIGIAWVLVSLAWPTMGRRGFAGILGACACVIEAFALYLAVSA